MYSSICQWAPFQEKCFQYPDAWLSEWDIVGIVIWSSLVLAVVVTGIQKRKRSK